MRFSRLAHRKPGRPARYAAALIAAAAGIGVRVALARVLGAHSPYLPSTLAVLFAARLGGRLPGLVATALSALGIDWFVLEPAGSLAVASSAVVADLVTFLVIGVLISLVAGRVGELLLALAQKAERLGQQTRMIDLSRDAVISMDASRRITTWNAGAREMYGWTEREALGKVIHNLLQTTDRQSVAEFDEMLRREGLWDGELKHVARDGRLLIAESRQVLVRNDQNQPVGILEINRDITERKRAQEALLASEEKLRLALEAARMGTWDWNLATGELMWSESCKVMFGLSPDQPVTYEVFLAAIHPEDRDRIDREVRLAVEHKAEYDVDMRVALPDGSLRWVAASGRVYYGEGGEPARMAGTVRDVTESKRAEEALRASEERLDFATRAAGMGVWSWKPGTSEIIVSANWKRIFGVEPDAQVSFETWLGRVHPDDRDCVLRELNAAARERREFNQEYRVVWPEGAVRTVADRGQASYDANGRAVGMAGVNVDITERKQAAERLQYLQKQESIGLLAGGVAHDFNNLLTVIMGSASAALADDSACENARAILSASEKAAQLTQQLLAYAGKGQFLVQPIDLSALVSRASRLLAASIPKRVRLELHLSEGLPLIEADPNRMEQAVLNLVVNAGEAIPPRADGIIDVSTAACEVTPELARRRSGAVEVRPGPYICLQVRDNGTGMDQRTLSRIFEPFFTTKFTGRGLGLAALEGIVGSAGGFVEVESAPGQGAKFRIYLPVSAKGRSAGSEPAPSRQQPRGAATILVVDDEDMVRKLAVMALRRAGYEVLEAANGEEALRVLSGARPTPSAALLDLAMPAMGGDELAPILKEKYPGIKIVLTSGYPEEEVRMGRFSASIAGFLQKPYTVSALTGKIAEAIGMEDARSAG